MVSEHNWLVSQHINTTLIIDLEGCWRRNAWKTINEQFPSLCLIALSACGGMYMKTSLTFSTQSSPSWRFKDCSTLVKKLTCLHCTDAFCITFNIIFSHSRKHGISTDSEQQTPIHLCNSGCCTERRDKICHRYMTIWSVFVLLCKTLLSVVEMSLFLLFELVYQIFLL